MHKSHQVFSAMVIHQACKQANAVIKDDKGAVVVTEDSSALRKWMGSGSEVSHLVALHIAASEVNDATQVLDNRHYEQT